MYDIIPSSRGESLNRESVSSELINEGTLILDATCAPVNIWCLQDVSPLNEPREKLVMIIYHFHKFYGIDLQ